MKLHSRAALTVRQRQEVKRLHKEEGWSIRRLAEHFRTNPTTIQRWISRESPLDRSCAPHNTQTVITPEYREAVLAYRREHPKEGPIRIALGLQRDFPFANRGTVLAILQQAKVTERLHKERRPRKHIPVGRHRLQLDIQQLPAIEGGHGRSYRIGIIHTATRFSYSEIRPDQKSKTIAEVLETALLKLPPFS